MAGALQHSMVPLHEVLPNEVALQELLPWGIESTDDFLNLPQIAIDDPALLDASLPRPNGVVSSWPAQYVVRITRRSAFSGVSVAYRYVVATSAFGRTRSDLEIDEEDIEFIEDEDEFSELTEGLKDLADRESELEEQEKQFEEEGISTEAMSDDELESFGEFPEEEDEEGEFE